jgi:hypothetical protein
LHSPPSGFSRWLAANTAVFSVADALFRPLAYHRPEQLVVIAEMIPAVQPLVAAHSGECHSLLRMAKTLPLVFRSGDPEVRINEPDRKGRTLRSAWARASLGESSAGRF